MIFKNKKAGLTMVETLVALGLFSLMGYVIYFSYSNVLDAMVDNQLRTQAINLLNNEVEVVRNMPYSDIGINGGYPIGKIQQQKNVSDGVNNFIIKAFVRNFDDPFDGTAGGNPNDTAPADYKIVEFEISCSNCPHFNPLTTTTTVAPKGLESSSKNGSLFVNVFDASGEPISGADVSVTNNIVNPNITISDTTNINGILQLIDIPTSTAAYNVKISKNGYSRDQSYAPGGADNPNPIIPDATVAQQQVTNISFAIDKISSLNIKTADIMCNPVPYVDLGLDGTKLIGTNPDILKYSTTTQTNQNGQKTVNNLEWDIYDLTNLSSNYNLAGSMPLLPIMLNPDASSTVQLVMASSAPMNLLATVTDETDQPANGASVNLTKSGFNQTIYSGRSSFSQADWSVSNYSGQSGNIDTESAPGQISLYLIDGKYSTTTEEWLVSKSFNLGNSNTKFYEINWIPDNQPPQTGSSSVKFQIATSNDDATWNFIGPDGTSSTFYTATGTIISAFNDGNRYFRYKVYLKTNDENYAPVVNDVSVSFSSDCVPSGRAYFSGLPAGTYTITVQKSGYQTYIDSALLISNNWKEYKIKLTKL